jgi:hypothetical protein
MTRRIEILLTDSQYADLAEQADKAGLVLTQWATSVLLVAHQKAVKEEVVEEVEVVEEEVIGDGLVDPDDALAMHIETSPPVGATKIERVYEVLPAWRGDKTSTRRLKSVSQLGTNGGLNYWWARPGSIFVAFHGTKKIQVGRGVDGKITWGETLPWDRAHRASTLDYLQTLATRDLVPSYYWEEDEVEDD